MVFRAALGMLVVEAHHVVAIDNLACQNSCAAMPLFNSDSIVLRHPETMLCIFRTLSLAELIDAICQGCYSMSS